MRMLKSWNLLPYVIQMTWFVNKKYFLYSSRVLVSKSWRHGVSEYTTFPEVDTFIVFELPTHKTAVCWVDLFSNVLNGLFATLICWMARCWLTLCRNCIRLIRSFVLILMNNAHHIVKHSGENRCSIWFCSKSLWANYMPFDIFTCYMCS